MMTSCSVECPKTWLCFFFLLLKKRHSLYLLWFYIYFCCHSLLYLFVSVDTCMLFYLESYSLYTTVVNLTNFTKLCAKFQLDFGFLNKHEKKIMRLGILCSRVFFLLLFVLFSFPAESHKHTHKHMHTNHRSVLYFSKVLVTVKAGPVGSDKELIW